MKLIFDISATEFETVRDILADIVPPRCRVWVFGSRAKNQTRFNSDLDLAFEHKDKLPQIILHKLKEAFSDSLLPYRVDVLDINDVSENFQTIIRQQAIAFPLAKSDKVPALRFPEFRGEWEETNLGEVAPKPSYGMNASAVPFDGIHKYIRITDIDEDTRVFAPNPLTSPQKPITKEYQLRSGDIVFTRTGASTGKTYLYNPKDGDLFFAGFLIRFRVKKDDPAFIYSQTLRPEYRKWVTVMSMRSGQPGINANEYSQLKFKMPTLPEQQKIASFLSAIDTKIAQITKKKALLEQYKRGVMQKLFSQELRFKDAQGKAFPDWVEKRLGEVVNIFDGTHQTPKYVKKGVPFYSVEHVTANQFETTKYISEEVFEKENKRVSIEQGDILMTRIGSIGVAKYVDWGVRASFYVSLALIKSTTSVASGFLAQCIADEFFQRELWKRTIHVAFPKKINLGEIGNCHIWLPHLKEQQKIANFLSAIDRKIDLITTELYHAKTFKKGLLQQMFV